MRIGILSTMQGCAWAGTEQVWHDIAQLALAKGHEVMLAADKAIVGHELTRGLMSRGLRVVSRTPFRPIRLYLLKESLRPEMKALWDFLPSVLLVNAGSLWDLLNLPYLNNFCSRITCPKVYFNHVTFEGSLPQPRSECRKLMQSMARVVFVSEQNRQAAERQLAVTLTGSAVVLNGPRLHFGDPMQMPPEPGIRMACVARLEVAAKGQDILLQTLSGQEWIGRDWSLDLYGEGPDRAYLQELIGHYGLAERVVLRGYCSDVAAIWAQHHLHVMCSHAEGTPLALLESMMCGRPAVVTDVGGNREVLEEGASGWIAEVPTPRSFGKALEQAWEHRGDWAAMGAAAHRRAKALAADDPAGQVLRILEEVGGS